MRTLTRMKVDRIVPNLTVDDLAQAVAEHRTVLGFDVLMDHGWIVTLGDPSGTRQLSLMTSDLTGPVNPAVSIFVDDVHEALARAQAAGLEIVHPLTDEPWGVTRFFYRDTHGNVINVGTHTAARPNALIEFHAAMRNDPVDLDVPARGHEEPRVTFDDE